MRNIRHTSAWVLLRTTTSTAMVMVITTDLITEAVFVLDATASLETILYIRCGQRDIRNDWMRFQVTSLSDLTIPRLTHLIHACNQRGRHPGELPVTIINFHIFSTLQTHTKQEHRPDEGCRSICISGAQGMGSMNILTDHSEVKHCSSSLHGSRKRNAMPSMYSK